MNSPARGVEHRCVRYLCARASSHGWSPASPCLRVLVVITAQYSFVRGKRQGNTGLSNLSLYRNTRGNPSRDIRRPYQQL